MATALADLTSVSPLSKFHLQLTSFTPAVGNLLCGFRGARSVSGRSWSALQLRGRSARSQASRRARHTAATVVLLLGVQERALVDVMGCSSSAMVKRYAHVTARLRRDIADRLNSYLWKDL